MRVDQNRRRFLTGLSAFGAASILGAGKALPQKTPEITTVRFADFPGASCIAPQYIAEGLLRAEGFTDFSSVPVDERGTAAALIGDDKADFGLDFVSALVAAVDTGTRVTCLSGVHVGCWELFAHGAINNVLDLKGKTVGVGPALGSDPHLYVSAMATYVGLDPRRDINWVVSDVAPMELFAERKIDALLGIALDVQELRARKLGHVVVSGTFDRPWSQYYCCMLVARADYVERYPIATKRVLRAILKSADICASSPDTVARQLIDAKRTANYDYTARMLAELPYGKWREFDPEDSIRFFSLRLREARMISSSPQDVIAMSADWRFLNELKRELKT